MSSIVIVGAGGMLGLAWQQVLTEVGLAYTAVGRPQVELTRPDTIKAAIPDDTLYVINCAAWTAVDAAEQMESEATKINGEAVGIMAQAVKDVGATLVHYSTDYVFAGDASEPYPVDAPRRPINAYGRSKAVGEELLEESGAFYLMARTSWLYASWGNNFVRTMARLSRDRSKLKVVDDQKGRPSYAVHVARSTLRLLDSGAVGTFHITDGGSCTWHGLTTEIARLINPECTIDPCSSDDFPRPAKRPAYSVLDLSRTEAILGPMPPWQQNVATALKGDVDG